MRHSVVSISNVVGAICSADAVLMLDVDGLSVSGSIAGRGVLQLPGFASCCVCRLGVYFGDEAAIFARFVFSRVSSAFIMILA